MKMAIIDDFDREESLLQQFEPKLKTLLQELLSSAEARVHSVDTRVKTRESLQRKLTKTEGKYQHLAQITDLCGARIITYFEDDVDAVAKLVEAEFKIDWLNSIDKRASRDVDRFGYASVHYIASLKGSRTSLLEYSRFQSIKFEVQIRSILQHTWAEIEHDLQYKSQESVPRELRRKFARLAGLLEIADAEFMGVRDEMRGYRRNLPQPLNSVETQTPLDLDSMKVFIEQSPVVIELDQRIAATIGVPVIGQMLESGFAFRVLNYLGVNAIESVHAMLSISADRIVRFAKIWLSRPDPLQAPLDSLPRGISLYYLAFDLILKTQESRQKTAEVLRSVGFRDGKEADELAQELYDVNEISRSEPNPSGTSA
jgi:putative GTP pyrophosphokinase